jgi:aryl-alcohol dehydrogenase-like predicted oxidoreductase
VLYRRLGRSGLKVSAAGLGTNRSSPRTSSANRSALGATRPEHVTENARAADWTMSADESSEIDALLKAKNVMRKA